MKKENIIKYGNPILAVSLVVIFGTIFTNIGLDWLDTLNKPSMWLANYIIPIVWTIIYSSFTIYLICIEKHNKMNKNLLTLLILNGIFNVLWCLIFFTFKNILLGLIFILINLWLSILLKRQIFKTNKTWGYVLLIYPIWLTIATCLNLCIWILN